MSVTPHVLCKEVPDPTSGSQTWGLLAQNRWQWELMGGGLLPPSPLHPTAAFASHSGGAVEPALPTGEGVWGDVGGMLLLLHKPAAGLAAGRPLGRQECGAGGAATETQNLHAGAPGLSIRTGGGCRQEAPRLWGGKGLLWGLVPVGVSGMGWEGGLVCL